MFAKSTWIRLPRNVVVGHGVLEKTGEAIDDVHLTGRPLVVSSPTPHEVAAGRRYLPDVGLRVATLLTATVVGFHARQWLRRKDGHCGG